MQISNVAAWSASRPSPLFLLLSKYGSQPTSLWDVEAHLAHRQIVFIQSRVPRLWYQHLSPLNHLFLQNKLHAGTCHYSVTYPWQSIFFSNTISDFFPVWSRRNGYCFWMSWLQMNTYSIRFFSKQPQPLNFLCKNLNGSFSICCLETVLCTYFLLLFGSAITDFSILLQFDLIFSECGEGVRNLYRHPQ